MASHFHFLRARVCVSVFASVCVRARVLWRVGVLSAYGRGIFKCLVF